MVRITQVYDNVDGTNQKVYSVRGDEGYARKTRIDVMKKSITHNTTTFDAELTVNVYRGLGESSLIIYDGDETLRVQSWSGNNTTETVTVSGLAYDMPHNIKIKYAGNSQSLQSTSLIVEYNESNPNAYATKLTPFRKNIPTLNDSETVGVTLKEEAHSTSMDGREIKFYLNGIYQSTSHCGSTGYTSATITGLTNGLNQVDAVFEEYVGSTRVLTGSMTTMNIGKGYNVDITSYPQVFVNGKSNTVKVRVRNYFGQNVSSATVTFNELTATTNSSGVATFNVTSIENNQKYRAECEGYYSEYITVKTTVITGISLSTDTQLVTPTKNAILTGQLIGENLQSNIPVTVGYGGLSETYYTNSRGQFSLAYESASVGDISVTASKSGYSSTVELEDVLSYWKANDERNYILGRTINGNNTLSQTGWYMNFPTGGRYVYGLGNGSGEIDEYTITFLNLLEQTDIHFHIGCWWLNDSGQIRTYYHPDMVSMDTKFFGANYPFEIIKEDGMVTISHGDVEYWNYEMDNTYEPCIFAWSTNPNNKRLKINEFKYKVR